MEREVEKINWIPYLVVTIQTHQDEDEEEKIFLVFAFFKLIFVHSELVFWLLPI